MASSSSLSGSSVDPTLTAEEIEDLKQLCTFAESDEFDFDDNEFNEVEVEPNSNCKAQVDALAHKFGVKLTEKGVGILTKLAGHFSLNNNAEYIVRNKCLIVNYVDKNTNMAVIFFNNNCFSMVSRYNE